MRRASQRPIESSGGLSGASGWVPHIVFVFGMVWVLWSVGALLTGGSELVAFYAVAGWFAVLALTYLGLYGVRGGALFAAPVLLTIEALVDFFGIPTWRFVTGDDQVDPAYVRAMFLILIGFTAFWIGTLLLMRDARFRFAPRTKTTSDRVIAMSSIFFVLGLGAKLVLWKTGLLAYTADLNLQDSTLPAVQWLDTVAGTLNAALLVSAIEVLGKKSKAPFIRFIFFASVVFSLTFGAISGMKGEILIPILILVLIYSITNARIPRIALLPVLIFPFVTAYRNNLNNGYRSQVNTVAGLATVVQKSFTDVVESNLTLGEHAGYGFDATTQRLSILGDVRDVIDLPDPSLLNGDEKVWMAPIYPFIPRFLWKGKPILDKGRRLSVALGRPNTTSSASTPIGDLYSLYGTWGVPVGMFIYGICMQIYMNSMRGALSENQLFVYFVMLNGFLNLEKDVVTQVAGIVTLGLIAFILAYVIYGRSPSALRPVRSPRLMGRP